jgi:pyruvate,water dikinase
MTMATIERSTYTYTFQDERCREARNVGGKGKGLAEMTTAGLPVPPGFTVGAEAYRQYLDQDGLRDAVAAELSGLGPDDLAAHERASDRITARLEAAPLPAQVAAEIAAAYAELCERTGVPDISVAVRSSATAEDSSADSFAGEFETWVDIRGIDAVLDHVHRCYTSVYAPRVIGYALERRIDMSGVEMAVVVQKTVRARAAGVMFTLDPVSGDRSRIVLESSWGLGLSVVGGEVTPDRYIVNKVGLTVSDRILGDKRVEYRTGGAPVEVPEERLGVLCLSDEEVLTLAKLGKSLEKVHGKPQDIEFAVDAELAPGENVLLLQCRPETIWSGVERKPAYEPGGQMMSWITSSILKPADSDGSAGRHSHD